LRIAKHSASNPNPVKLSVVVSINRTVSFGETGTQGLSRPKRGGGADPCDPWRGALAGVRGIVIPRAYSVCYSSARYWIKFVHTAKYKTKPLATAINTNEIAIFPQFRNSL
jgi:hypothetical protein